MRFEIIEKLEICITNPTSSGQLLSIQVNLRVMFFLLILIFEDFFADFALEFCRRFLFDAEVDALMVLTKILGLSKISVADIT